MENNQTITQEAPAPKHKLNKANIVMAILFVLALAAAITFGILWATKKTEAPVENSNTEACQTDEESKKESQSEDKDSVGEQPNNNALSVAEAEKLLERYIGEGNTMLAYPLSAHYNTFASDFNDQQKAFLTYSSVTREEEEAAACVSEWYEQGSCTGRSISYDLMSEKYELLFGDYGAIEKKNYSFHNFFYLVYDDSINAYREYILPGGGTTSLVAMYKIVSVKKSGNNTIASLTFATLDTGVEEQQLSGRGAVVRNPDSDPVAMIYLPSSTASEIVDSMAVYEFTLSPYNDSYVLTAVKKV